MCCMLFKWCWRLFFRPSSSMQQQPIDVRLFPTICVRYRKGFKGKLCMFPSLLSCVCVLCVLLRSSLTLYSKNGWFIIYMHIKSAATNSLYRKRNIVRILKFCSIQRDKEKIEHYNECVTVQINSRTILRQSTNTLSSPSMVYQIITS